MTIFVFIFSETLIIDWSEVNHLFLKEKLHLSDDLINGFWLQVNISLIWLNLRLLHGVIIRNFLFLNTFVSIPPDP